MAAIKGIRMASLVFVFGTLKEGFPNYRANAGERLPGEFHTVEKYPLYLIGERYSPWLINCRGQGHHVRGQVFRVTDEALARMDLLERVSEPDGYQRVEILVELTGSKSGAAIAAYAYLKPRESMEGVSPNVGPLRVYTLENASLYRPPTARGL